MLSGIRFDRNCIFAAIATLIAVLSLMSATARALIDSPDATPTATESVLYSFGVGPTGSTCTKIDDGADPKGSLTYVSATGLLFGRTSTTTSKGNGDGTIFQIMPDGSDYVVDHFFTGAKTDGNDPRHNAMTLVGTVLYGTTLTGGQHDNGTIFSINDDGTGYSTPPVFDFPKSANEQRWRSAAQLLRRRRQRALRNDLAGRQARRLDRRRHHLLVRYVQQYLYEAVLLRRQARRRSARPAHSRSQRHDVLRHDARRRQG